jgi:hypothetical protein
MEIKSNLCSNATRKIGLLITKASELGMDVSGYGFADENNTSGNVYLWLEDYPFTLYIGLGSDTIYALWSNPNDGEEVEIDVAGMPLHELEDWAQRLYNQADAEEEGLEWFSTGSGRIELQISLSDAQSASHQGQCDDDVLALSKVPYIAEQLAKIDPALLRDELREYGAWDGDELSDHAQNLQRLLWLACGDIVDSHVLEA